MNGKPVIIKDNSDKTSLTLQNPGGTGSATIGISAENTTKLFQSAERTLSIIFRK
jgi:5,10-methylene-tetrahydrofolate dehydrogenase/methenyl tetrahydrofolate cyclohydrolase